VVSRLKTRANLMRSHINRYYFIRKHYGTFALHLFRPIMTAGAMLRLLTYVVVWLACPGRRAEAGRKVIADCRILLRGVARTPDALPDDLRREHTNAELRPIQRWGISEPRGRVGLSSCAGNRPA
jgi:hypothetical protein